MVAVFAENPGRLVEEERIEFRNGPYREAPVGIFDLQVESEPVSRLESRLRGTPRVEPYGIQPVVLTHFQNPEPFVVIRRRIARDREFGRVDVPAQEQDAVVDREPGSLGREIAHTECLRRFVGEGILPVGSGHGELRTVEVGRELVPQQHLVAQRIFITHNEHGIASRKGIGPQRQLHDRPVFAGAPQGDFALDAPFLRVGQRNVDLHLPAFPVGIELDVGHADLVVGANLHVADDAVPVGLGLGADGMRVFQVENLAVVHPEADRIPFAELHPVRDVELMGRREAHLPADGVSVDPGPHLPVRPFEVNENPLAAPLFGNEDILLLVPGGPGVFEHAGQADRRHVLCLVSFARLVRRTGQRDGFGQLRRKPASLDGNSDIRRIEFELPYSGQRQGFLFPLSGRGALPGKNRSSAQQQQCRDNR